ncbi:uncharacterized protein [Nicotiana sylvestris]|uniref:uncharacterized protein n=1 Tax=Nicotiana sylvestris TaxID=4096 RepID=UPI00388C6C72
MAKTFKTVPKKDKASSSRPDGLGDKAFMRFPPPREEEALKPAKDKKRKRVSPSNTPMPKKNKARKSKQDVSALYENAVMLHREAFSKFRAELNRDIEVEAEHRPPRSKKDTARAQLSSVEHQLQSVKEESLARSKKIEELEARLAAELAKATSKAEKVKAEVEAVVAIYRADAKDTNARAKEISDATEVRLSCVFEHAKCQSQRETLEEIHARGFVLLADIENAKVLQAEVEALLSADDDSGSASRSKSGEDKDEAPGED